MGKTEVLMEDLMLKEAVAVNNINSHKNNELFTHDHAMPFIARNETTKVFSSFYGNLFQTCSHYTLYFTVIHFFIKNKLHIFQSFLLMFNYLACVMLLRSDTKLRSK